MVRRARMILACFLPLLVSSQAGTAQEEKRDPEDRLLKAELLEVSTGDLEKAMAVYKEIQGDEKAPASARARAMLYLGRCHRKRGEIDAAKKTLDDLVKSYASEREVVRQAQGFLRELQGRPENPNFDWLKELEKSPEIQARVFELAMDLVDPGTEAGRRAQRQLIALGTIAVPVLERVIETSRDPRQRQYLALMLLYAGRYERIGAFLHPNVMEPIKKKQGPSTTQEYALQAYLSTLPLLSADDRGRLLAALEKLPAHPVTDPYRDLIRLWAGDTGPLLERLKSIDDIVQRGILSTAELLPRLLGEAPGATEVFAGRILDRSCPFLVRKVYLDLLLEKSPEKLGSPHWAAFFEGSENIAYDPYFEALEKRGSLDILKELASTPLGTKLSDYFWNKRVNGKVPPLPSEGWAKVLRALKEFKALQLLAK